MSLAKALAIAPTGSGCRVCCARALAESGALFDIEVNASPILAAETLRRNLWNVAHGCLVTSATLTALGTFDRYRMRAGLPKAAVTAVVPSPFHHADAGVLRVFLRYLHREGLTATDLSDAVELVKFSV